MNGGPYRPEAKPLEKCLNFMKIGARTAASASMTTAMNIGAASKAAAIAVGKKTIEVKNHMAPVFAPIIDAVVEESKFHLMGPDPITATGRGRAAPSKSPSPSLLLECRNHKLDSTTISYIELSCAKSGT